MIILNKCRVLSFLTFWMMLPFNESKDTSRHETKKKGIMNFQNNTTKDDETGVT